METVFPILQKIIPEGMDDLQRRYNVLQGIYHYQPIGRRTLAAELQYTERTIRRDTEFLKQYRLLEVSTTGMMITQEGIDVLQKLKELMYHVKGFSDMEDQISRILDIDRVSIVPGDVDENPMVKKDLGKLAAQLLKQSLSSHQIITITGGSTVAEVVQAMPVTHKYDDILVVPARGSLGYEADHQSNALVSQFAPKIGASYELLNIPDNLSKKTLETVRNEPLIQHTLQKIVQADTLLFGIGNALQMAERRHVPEAIIDFLQRKQAVAEAFGYYFDEKGTMVYTSPSVGIKLEQMKRIPYTVAVAGGASKAKAIYALSRVLKQSHLVIDEGAAKELLRYSNTNPL